MIQYLMRVIVYVQDMDAQVRFYRDVMGITVKSPADLEDYSGQFWVEFDTGQCVLTLHGGGQKRLGADTPKLVFEVDDIEGMRQHLIQQGIQMDKIFSPAPGTQTSNGFDPEGNPFSIDQHGA